MYIIGCRAKVFSRLERTHIPGHENSKSQGVAMTSVSGRGGSDFGSEIETRGPRAVILAFYPRSHVQPRAEGMATVVTHCVFLPPVGSSRRHKGDESIGQLSVYIG